MDQAADNTTGSAPTRQLAPWQEDLGIGVLLSAAAFSLYLATLCPTVYWYDSAELAAAATVLGIPHPPGYPGYVLLGHVFSWLGEEPAFGVNLMSACFGALAVGMFYGVARELCSWRGAAILAALSFAATESIWTNATIAEVYTPGIAVALGVWWLCISSMRRGDLRGAYVAALLGGLGLSLHMAPATAGTGLALLVLVARAGDSVRGDLSDLRDIVAPVRLAPRLLRCVLATMLALSGTLIFLWIPWRAAQEPVIAFPHILEPGGFWWFVRGGSYVEWRLQGVPVHLLVLRLVDNLIAELGVLPFVAALGGLVTLLRERTAVGLALTLGIVGNLAFFSTYAVHDLQVFLLPSATLLLLCYAVAIDKLRALALERLEGRESSVLAAQWALGLGAGALVVLALVANFAQADRGTDDTAQAYGEQLCEKLPPRAVMLSLNTPPEWHDQTVFDYYYLRVKRCRRDVAAIGEPELVLVVPAVVAQLQAGRPVMAYRATADLEAFFVVEPVAELRPLVRIVGLRVDAPLEQLGLTLTPSTSPPPPGTQ